MRALDVVIHASVEPEPFGRVLAEAMVCARPVVATNAGGVPEVLGRDGAAGLLVPSGESLALATAVLDLVGDPSRREAMGINGRKRAQELFDIRLHPKRIEAVYDTVLANC